MRTSVDFTACLKATAVRRKVGPKPKEKAQQRDHLGVDLGCDSQSTDRILSDYLLNIGPSLSEENIANILGLYHGASKMDILKRAIEHLEMLISDGYGNIVVLKTLESKIRQLHDFQNSPPCTPASSDDEDEEDDVPFMQHTSTVDANSILNKVDPPPLRINPADYHYHPYSTLTSTPSTSDDEEWEEKLTIGGACDVDRESNGTNPLLRLET